MSSSAAPSRSAVVSLTTKFCTPPKPATGKKTFQIEGRNHRRKAGAIDGVVGRLHVAPALRRPVHGRELCLEGDHGVGTRRGARVADELEDLRDVGFVGGAIGVERGAFVQVIVAHGHAEAGLRDVDDVAGGVGRIGRDVHADRTRVVDVAHEPNDVGLRSRGGDRFEIGFERLDAARFDRRFVHPRRVKVGNLLPHGAGGGRRRGELVEQRAHVDLGLVAQRVEDAVARLVGRHRKRRYPLAVDVAVEVVAGLHGGVHRRKVDAECADCGLRRFRGRWRDGGFVAACGEQSGCRSGEQ